jgi:hypothetical protein
MNNLADFLSKLHLRGMTESAPVKIENGKTISFFSSDDRSVAGYIEYLQPTIEAVNTEFVVYNTSTVLNALKKFKNPETKIGFKKTTNGDTYPNVIYFKEGRVKSQFVVAIPQVAVVPKVPKQSDLLFSLVIDEEMLDFFKKFEKIIDSEHISFQVNKENKIEVVFGSNGKHLSDKIVYTTNKEANEQFETIYFFIKPFVAILIENMHCEYHLEIKVYEQYLTFECKSDKYNATYYLKRKTN